MTKMRFSKQKQRSHKTRRLRLRAAIHFLNNQPSLSDLRFYDYSYGFYR